MITIQHEALHRKITFGSEKAKRLRKPVLVSYSLEAEQPINPLAFFAAGHSVFPGERSFWSDPSRELALVGAGESHIVRPSPAYRFKDAEKQWKQLIETAVYDGDTAAEGTGPLMIGGFSFDPLKPVTKLWNAFEHTKLTVPTFLLTIVKGNFYLTINIMVDHTADADSLYEKAIGDQESLFSSLTAEYPVSFPAHVYTEEIAPDHWKDSVAKLAEEVREGVIEKVVTARELRLYGSGSFSPDAVLGRLLEQQPQSYIFAFESGTDCFVGATPERLIKRSGTEVLSTCLAGTIARGSTHREDEQLGKELLQDEKNLHEHALVVKMIKQAMEAGCDHVEVPDSPALYKVRDIQHLYTPVKGKAKSDATLLSMVEKLHPTPALGGFPQEQAMEKIRTEEIMDRGWYAAPIGWMDVRGNGEFAVGIRSGLLQGDEASLFAGCGIVGDSDPECEYVETKMKFKPMLSALGGTLHDNSE
ncbi:isochorismate synthase [Bacillus marinisedimentorum]|uniref:isochorismate synthase n=1 Tax=Bacillus marinisedimentorum TaxID=1821260 RepID=UPI0008723537|nr:isochorismate synthase [Bacillus marinisedimentorum]